MNVFELADQAEQQPYDEHDAFEQLFEQLLGVKPEYDDDMGYYPQVGGVEFDVYRIGNRQRLLARVWPGDWISVSNIQELRWLESDEYLGNVVEQRERHAAQAGRPSDEERDRLRGRRD